MAVIRERRPYQTSIKAIWACLKKHDISNLCLDIIGEAGQFAASQRSDSFYRQCIVVPSSQQQNIDGGNIGSNKRHHELQYQASTPVCASYSIAIAFRENRVYT